MAKVVSTPQSVFSNNEANVGKFCLTDEEIRHATTQYKEDLLQAIIIVSEEVKEEANNVKDETTWFGRLKNTASQWYNGFTQANVEYEKSFEERVDEVRIRIVQDRYLKETDPGYEC